MKKRENIFWVTKRGNRGLQIGARGITNRGRDYKSVQDTRKIEP